MADIDIKNLTDIKSMSVKEIADFMGSIGEAGYRGKQIFSWLNKGVRDFQEMTDLSKNLRIKLAENCVLYTPVAVRKQVSKIDGTIKILWRFHDGNHVESVFMKYKHGNTVCVSTQAGCRMNCAFCASGIRGLARNLTPGEILDEVIFTGLEAGQEISNIVLMGIGEPMDNLENVLKFLELVNSPDGLNIGMRHISLSTCGLIPGIKKLADIKSQFTLSVSLHAPDDETRSRLMPVNRAWPVDALFTACHEYFEKTGRRISFEYALIDGVNDHDWQADRIAEKLRGMPGHINLIRLNHVAGSGFQPSKRLRAFQTRLESRGVTATVRRELGSDIDAACGQLRSKQEARI